MVRTIADVRPQIHYNDRAHRMKQWSTRAFAAALQCGNEPSASFINSQKFTRFPSEFRTATLKITGNIPSIYIYKTKLSLSQRDNPNSADCTVVAFAVDQNLRFLAEYPDQSRLHQHMTLITLCKMYMPKDGVVAPRLHTPRGTTSW